MSSILYKAVCARLLQVDFTERINLCCLCLETVGESGASVEDEVVLDVHLRGRLKLANILKFLMDETFSEVMDILKSVCKQCVSNAIAGYKFIQSCKDNAKKLTAVIDSLEVSLDKLITDDKAASLYIAIQPCNKSTAMIERFYDVRRQFVPEDTAFLRFSQIVERRQLSSEASQYDINEASKQTMNTKFKLDQTLQDLMCCKAVLDTKKILDNPDKPNEFRCKICKELYSKSASLRVHFFKVHRQNELNCAKCKTTKGTQAKMVGQKQPVEILDRLKTIDTEYCSDPLDSLETDELTIDHLHYEENCENKEENENSITVVPTELLIQDRNCGKVLSPTSFDIKNQFIVKNNTETDDNCCNNCGMKFSTRARYLTHKNKYKNNDCHRHKGRGEFKCDLCNYTAFYKHLLRTHIQSKHFGVKAHMCPYCDRNCLSNAELVLHLRKHTCRSSVDCSFGLVFVVRCN